MASPVIATIDLDALASNLSYVRGEVGDAAVMAVVKADAYGHGAVPVAARLEAEGVDAFGVARIEEGIELREAGVESDIVILSGVFEDRAGELVSFRLTPVLYDLDVARALNASLTETNDRIDYQLKIDTGMSRVGISTDKVLDAMRELSALDRLELTALVSHFSESESEDPEFTQQQLAEFLKFNWNVPRHIANSMGALNHPKARLDMVRPGIVLYTHEPVMQLLTRVIQVKTVPSGTPISYGRQYVTNAQTTLATLAVGYGDGYSRALSNQGEVLIHGRRAPIRGAVCMDLTVVDVTEIEGVSVGDEAVLLGVQGDDRITADEIASLSGTIAYEVFTAVSKRVPRVYVGGTQP